MIKDILKNKCELLSENLDLLNTLLIELKQQIILQDLSNILDIKIDVGRKPISGFDWLEEISIDGETFSLINKHKGKYCSYVVYTKKPYHTIGLGLMYKGEVIAPHLNHYIESIIAKYNNEELEEISKLIDDYIIDINQDIDYLKSNPNPSMHSHYYGEYNKGFESHNLYETISEVIDDYRKR